MKTPKIPKLRGHEETNRRETTTKGRGGKERDECG